MTHLIVSAITPNDHPQARAPRPGPAPLDQLAALAELAQLDQWVISKPVRRRGKLDKPPFSPHTHQMCSHSDPSHWSSYSTARAALAGFAWLGFVFHDADPYSGIDLDGCLNPDTGAIEPWAQHIIDLVNSYTEISPSQTGVKIFARGTLAATVLHSLGPHKGIEIYSRQRYFTVTGAHLAGTPTEIRDAQSALDQLAKHYTPAPPEKPSAPTHTLSLKPRTSAGRASLVDVRARFTAEHPLDQLIESYGATKTKDGYTCPFCEHTHQTTLYITKQGRLFSFSPNCTLYTTQGWDSFGLYCKITHNNDVIAAARALNPIAPRPKRQDPPPPAEPERRQQTPAQAANAARKRQQRSDEAAQIRADVERRAAADDRLTSADRATLAAMLAWAAERNAACCWLGRAAIAVRSGYSLGAVKRSVMHLEQLGYFESTGNGGRPIDTAKRTFTRGSSLQPETIFVPNDDPRIDITRDLPTLELIASERAAEPPALGEPDSLDTWQAAGDMHGADELVILDAPALVEPAADLEIAASLVEPDRALLSRVRQLARQVAEPFWELRDYAGMSSAALAGEAQRLEAVLRSATQLVEPASDQAAGASYTPPSVEPSGAYTGRAKHLVDFSTRWRWSSEAIGMRSGQIAQLVEPPAAQCDEVQLNPNRLQACPPAPHDPRYGAFAWRWHAARQLWRSAGQRAYFHRQALALCDYAAPDEATRRWLAFHQPPAPVARRRGRPAPRSQARERSEPGAESSAQQSRFL